MLNCEFFCRDVVKKLMHTLKLLADHVVVSLFDYFLYFDYLSQVRQLHRCHLQLLALVATTSVTNRSYKSSNEVYVII